MEMAAAPKPISFKEEGKKVKSYTIKPILVNELAKRARAERRSASNYLEQILEEKFNII